MMEVELLRVMDEEMASLGINYEYGEYTGDLVYPYAVGEFNENLFAFENNATRGEMILTCFNRGEESPLVEIKERVKKHFSDFRQKVEGGTINIAYDHKLFIRSGEAGLKKMEIYLDVQYWEGV